MNIRRCGAILICCGLASIANAQEKVIFNFSKDKTGWGAVGSSGSLAVRSDGFVYGTAINGGTGPRGQGVVFEAKPPTTKHPSWDYTVIYRFANTGRSVGNGVAAPGNGLLYGLSSAGGENECGFAYQLTPPGLSHTGKWEETTLYNFGKNLADSCSPENTQPLYDPATGSLYGTTQNGGEGINGTLFRLDPPAKSGGAWTETVLYTFTGGSDGGFPLGGITGNPDGGIIYGTTAFGGSAGFGVVWGYDTSSRAMQTVYTFLGGSDGANPYGGVTGPFPDGVGSSNYYLLGTTFAGGGSSQCGEGCGTVFAINLPSTVTGSATDTILHAFQGTDGAFVQSGLAMIGGAAWGVTNYGGTGWSHAAGGNGTLYEIQVSGTTHYTLTYLPLRNFQGGPTDGATPSTALAGDSSGNIYGMTQYGGSNGVGTLFEFVP